MEKDSSKNDGTKIEILELESHFVLVLGVLAVRESLENAAVSENLACEQLAAIKVKMQKGAKLQADKLDLSFGSDLTVTK